MFKTFKGKLKNEVGQGTRPPRTPGRRHGSREPPSLRPARSGAPRPDAGGLQAGAAGRRPPSPGAAGRGWRREAGEGSRAAFTRPRAAAGPSPRLPGSRPDRGAGRGGVGEGERPGSSFPPEAAGQAGSDEADAVRSAREPGPRVRPPARRKEPPRSSPAARRRRSEPLFRPMPGGYGVMGDDGAMDYSVHEAWNEATNVYLVVILVSFGLFMYAKRNKRKIMRIFSLPPPAETLSEPNFYDTISKIRLRQQLEMYSISRKYDYQQPQNQADSVQLSLE
ncbi:hypothetical protein R6Z07F_019588 [Ovis aries]